MQLNDKTNNTNNVQNKILNQIKEQQEQNFPIEGDESEEEK